MGAGRGKEKPHNPLMISVQMVRIRPGKGKGKSDGWFPQPLIHNTRRVCTDDPENQLPMHSLCPTREWERQWYGVTTPNIILGQGVWRQVGEYAAVTDFVWLRRMNLVLDDAKKEGKGMCPCHQV